MLLFSITVHTVMAVSSRSVMFWSIVSLLLFFFLFLGQASGQAQNNCRPLRCGDQCPEIRFPFRIKDLQPPECGIPGFELSCRGQDTIIDLPIREKFHVRWIYYSSNHIDLQTPNNCLLQQYLNIKGVSLSPFRLPGYQLGNFTMLNCSEAERSPDSVSCLSKPGFQILVLPQSRRIDEAPSAFCTKMNDIFSVPLTVVSSDYLSLSWTRPDCTLCETKKIGCRLKNGSTNGETECFAYPVSNEGKIRTIVATAVTFGTLALTVLLYLAYRAYSYNKQDNESRKHIETFLQDYKALKPSRYTYNDIKHITEQFKDKLGEGAYGAVYKGKLSDTFFVAVKILNSTKGNGGEFINEVGTIGRIHHVNVVRLVGYCADGFRRALVYEFLPRGSLQQYISSPDTEHFLGWKSLYEIALAIAKGIEYLHQGCDQRILHFDIKPHNILLDENFTPKISDFGLAKLCSKDQSIVSMTTARGTMGYIAPEVFSRNFGNVSYKSDVYSFGMVLLEMVGGKKITEVNDDDTTQIYYPEWIYNLLEQGDDLRIHIGDSEDDAMMAKKLAIVGLWCIQWHPADRPSMKAAVHMLEGGESLAMPPNPFSSTGSTQLSTAITIRKRLNPELESIAELE